jgi:hypothetical protein
MLVLALVSWCVRPFEEPAMTEIVIVLSSGSERPDFLFMTESGQPWRIGSCFMTVLPAPRP